VLASSENTVSCPKKGTSVHTLPSLSIISKTPIIFSSVISNVANFSDVVNVSVVVLILPEKALTFFLSKNSDGSFDVRVATVISVGS